MTPRATTPPAAGPAPGRVTPALVLAAVAAVGAAVRVGYLGLPITADEAYTVNEYASSTLHDAVSLYTFPNNHLFHTLLVHLTIRTFGESVWAVRLPALAAGLALIPATYALVRRWCDPTAAGLAAALAAGSRPLIYYSAQARGYSIVALVTVLLIVTADRLTTRERPRDWLTFTALPALGLFTIPTMLYPYAGVVAWLVLSRLTGRARGPRLDRLVMSGLVALVLTAALYTPTFLRTGLSSVTQNRFVAPRPIGEVVRGMPGHLTDVWSFANGDIPGPLAAGFVAAWAAGQMVRSPGRRGVVVVTGLVLTLFAASLAVMLAQRVIPFERVWLFLVPLYWSAVGAGLGSLAGRWAGGGAGAGRARTLAALVPVPLALGLAARVVWGGSIPAEAARLSVVHADAIARRLARTVGPDDAVITGFPGEPALKFHLRARGVPVEVLYDYRVARARRLFVVVNRPAGHTLAGVLAEHEVTPPPGGPARLVEDFGGSALYVLDRP